MKQQGLTLIEVLIAVMVLGVGVIAAASMQTTSLKASSTARIVQEVTNAARTEMELQRKQVRGSLSAAPEPCLSNPSYKCEVVVVPCRLISGVLSCSMAQSGTVVADQITVTVVGPQASEVRLDTVVAR